MPVKYKMLVISNIEIGVMWSIWTINNHIAGPGRVERVANSFMNKLEVEQVFVPSVTSIENSLIHYVGLIEILTTLNTVPT